MHAGDVDWFAIILIYVLLVTLILLSAQGDPLQLPSGNEVAYMD